MNFEIKAVVKSNGECDVVHVKDGKVLHYDLESGDILVDLGNYNDFIKPKWNGVMWVENATQEEIDELNNQPQKPTTDEMIMLAIAELDMQREVDKTEVELAIAELAETILGGI